MLLKQQYEDLQSSQHMKEQYNQNVTRDHIELKHIFEIEERAKMEENEAIR